MHTSTVKDINNAEPWKQLIQRWESVGAFVAEIQGPRLLKTSEL